MSLSTSTPPKLPEPGTLVAGKYEVERVLGHGGMGVVVAAKHLALKQRVAIKFLLPAAMELPEAAARFLREAQAAAAIQSEHVARVIDVGSMASGEPYLVMEYLAGEDLGVLFKTRRQFPIAEAIDMVLEACEGLAEAHHLGIVHRDLKPGNLFLTTRRADGSPLVKVLDFGLSKALTGDRGSGENSLTTSTAVIGSPLYMSPEQLRSLKNVDARTDIWSLGVILYMLLAGRRPYDGETMTAICAAIISETPSTLSELPPEVPLALDALVRRCLEKDLPRRVQSVAELARGLAPFGSPAARLSMERIVKVLPDAATSSGPEPRSEAAPSAWPPRRHPPPGAERSLVRERGGQLLGPHRRRPAPQDDGRPRRPRHPRRARLRRRPHPPLHLRRHPGSPAPAATITIPTPTASARLPDPARRSRRQRRCRETAKPSAQPVASASAPASARAAVPAVPAAAARGPAPAAAPKASASATVAPAAKPTADPMERWN